jgi:hypothetical protein
MRRKLGDGSIPAGLFADAPDGKINEQPDFAGKMSRRQATSSNRACETLDKEVMGQV